VPLQAGATSGLSDGASEVVVVDEHSQFKVLATSGMIFFREGVLEPGRSSAAQTSCN
jgi:hypothetical protein